MEAARQLPDLWERRRAAQRVRELEQLRPLGEAFLLRRFGGQLGRADAEDAIADVILRLHRKIEAGQPPRNLRAAFFTSARNAAVDQLRHRAIRPTAALEAAADAPAPDPPPAECALAHDDAARLQEALGRMRPNYREALVLRFGLGLTVPEIAEHLGISLPAAKKLVLRSTAQARARVEEIEAAAFCPEARDLARRSLLDRELAGLASPSERLLLRKHLRHCGACRSFLAELRGDLHEFGAASLLAGAAADHAQLGPAAHLGRLLGGLAEGAHAAAGRLRLAAYRASGAFSPADVTSAGALSSTAQKAVAICGAATATTATCLATGIIGPGLGAAVASHHQAHAHRAPVAKVSVAPEVPAEVPYAPASEQPTPAPSESASHSESPSHSEAAEAPPPEPTPTPSQQGSEEFGFESGGGEAAASSTASEATASSTSSEPAPPPASTPSGSGSGGGGSGTEHFGFGG